MDERVFAVIVLSPLLVGLGLVTRLLGESRPDEDAVRGLSIASLLIAFAGAAGALVRVVLGGPFVVPLGTWLDLGAWRVDFGLDVTAAGAAFAVFALGLTTAVAWFSGPYVHREAGFLRLYGLLSLFGAAMALVGLAGNVLLLFVGWELGGLCSALLIGFYPDRPSSPRAGARALITNRVGDVALLVAAFALYGATGTVDWSGLDALAAGPAVLVAGGALVAGAVKSGQLPFTSWVGRSVEGPTPTSALFYGSVMLTAGLMVVTRFEPALDAAGPIRWVAVPIGLSTWLYAAIVAKAQSDAKNQLVYRAVSGLGVAYACAGAGFAEVGLAVAIGLGVVRTTQMLLAPGTIAQRALRPATAPPGWLARRGALQLAASDRVWVEELSDQVVVGPVIATAKVLEGVERGVFERATGSAALAVEALGARAAHGERSLVWTAEPRPDGAPRGIVGLVIEALARGSRRFERAERWVGQRIPLAGERTGGRLDRLEALLRSPYWLVGTAVVTVLLVMAR
jgi:NADH:ubiquinone oxidoreductase subunit 2 (subunit N)